jgi:hypothetical protein
VTQSALVVSSHDRTRTHRRAARPSDTAHPAPLSRGGRGTLTPSGVEAMCIQLDLRSTSSAPPFAARVVRTGSRCAHERHPAACRGAGDARRDRR